MLGELSQANATIKTKTDDDRREVVSGDVSVFLGSKAKEETDESMREAIEEAADKAQAAMH